MLSTTVCRNCRIAEWGLEQSNEPYAELATPTMRSWVCPAIKSKYGLYGYVYPDQDPPKGCRCLMEHGMEIASGRLLKALQ